MTTIYKLKSSAIRAAKNQFGDDWKEGASVVEVEGGFVIQTEIILSIMPPVPTVADQLAAIDADVKAKKAKKKEIESRKPAFIPSTPITIDVAKEIEADPIPSLIEVIQIAPPADSPVPDEGDTKGLVEESPGVFTNADADAQANAALVNVDPAKPRMSTIPLPTKAVWNIADDMYFTAEEAGQPAPKRKEVIEECVRQGIAYGTARTQYQHWFKCMNDSKATPIATIGPDGKIVPPAK